MQLTKIRRAIIDQIAFPPRVRRRFYPIASRNTIHHKITNEAMINTVIVGAGPYGLSIAAYFRRHGIPFRIFGRPMDSWTSHMPKGMALKSDGFSCNLYDPDRDFTLKDFCAERDIEYSDAGIPVRLETFSSYGMAFQQKMVPDLDERIVVSLERSSAGFSLTLEDGEIVTAQRVVLAVGITHFEYIPESMADLPAQFVSHSFRHHDLESFRGRSVAVIGGGASAIDLSGLLRDVDADVQLVARKPALRFHEKASTNGNRSWWQRVRYPQSGIGTGFQLRFFAEAPMCFHYLPERLRLDTVRTTLGPSGGWFVKDKVVGRVPLVLGCTTERAEVQNGRVHLHLRCLDGCEREIVADHVIAATGYRVNLNRLTFLSPEIQKSLKTVDDTPVLSSRFESSVRGLYFVGVAAANSFGPVLRFAYGAGFAARNLTETMLKATSGDHVVVPVSSVAQPANETSRHLIQRLDSTKSPSVYNSYSD
jgi:thioredoxin reductase